MDGAAIDEGGNGVAWEGGHEGGDDVAAIKQVRVVAHLHIINIKWINGARGIGVHML